MGGGYYIFMRVHTWSIIDRHYWLFSLCRGSSCPVWLVSPWMLLVVLLRATRVVTIPPCTKKEIVNIEPFGSQKTKQKKQHKQMTDTIWSRNECLKMHFGCASVPFSAEGRSEMDWQINADSSSHLILWVFYSVSRRVVIAHGREYAPTLSLATFALRYPHLCLCPVNRASEKQLLNTWLLRYFCLNKKRRRPWKINRWLNRYLIALSLMDAWWVMTNGAAFQFETTQRPRFQNIFAFMSTCYHTLLFIAKS